jgi:hypothetical protein
MSNSIKQIAMAFGIFILFLGLNTNKVQANPNIRVSLQVFYDELAYHGDWVNNPDYGYVWRPNVGRDFRPYYTNGHWTMTEFGNTWVSDYEWGWAPFHYGRWFYDDYDGWIWMPDTEWGPAWVSWRTGGGYYGWAPLGPRININIGRRFNVPSNYWVFIPQRCIYYPSYARYWTPQRNVYILNNTTIINNIYTNRNVRFYSGPGVDEVRRATRQNVPVYRIADQSRPGTSRISKDRVNIYRPDINKDDRNSAPRNIASQNARPSRAGDNNTGRSGDANVTPRTQRPDAGANNDGGRTNQQPVNRGAVERPTSKPESTTKGSTRIEAPTRTERPVDSGSDKGRSSAPAKQEPTKSSRPERVERTQPTAKPRSSEPAKTESNTRPTRKGN